MEIRTVKNIPFSEYEYIMPAERYKWVRDAKDSMENMITVIAMDGDINAGYCTIGNHSANRSQSILLFIFVLENYRRTGLGSELLRQACTQMGTLGHKTITAELMKGEYPEFFTAEGFRLCNSTTYMYYNGNSLSTSEFGKRINLLKPYMSKVVRLGQISRAAYEDFRGKMTHYEGSIDIDKLDSRYSKCYVDDRGYVVGYMAFRRTSSGRFLHTDMYISKSNDSKYVIPCIVASILFGKDLVISDTGGLTLYFNSPVHVSAMEQGFGPADHKVESFDYIRD